jgi:outer membrane protein OmpA-like peptidoglycan-associated protein
MNTCVMKRVALVAAGMISLSGCRTLPEVGAAIGLPSPGAAPAALQANAGCTPVYSATRNQTIGGGAVLGALSAALLSKAMGGGRVANRNAALAGAIFGGGLGASYADQIKASEQPDGSIRLDIPSKVMFGFDSDKVAPGFDNALRQVAGKIMEFCDVTARVVGHTDNVGAVPYNEALSLRRATSVQAMLRSLGVTRAVNIEGRGPHQPVAPNTTEDGRSANRRVELFLMPPPRT